jgi:hypothetical protein|tara:strand:- start:606 stop:791 length:186 start_codon:yes stop_codon:yes gene_type:complete
LQRSLIALTKIDSRSHALFLQAAGQHLKIINEVVEALVLSSNHITVSAFDQIIIEWYCREN